MLQNTMLLILPPLILIIIIGKLDGFPILSSGFHMAMLMYACLPIPNQQTFMWKYKRKQKNCSFYTNGVRKIILIDEEIKEKIVLNNDSEDQQWKLGSMTAVWLLSALSESKCVSKPEPEDTGVKT